MKPGLALLLAFAATGALAQPALTGLNHLDQFAWIGSFSGAYNLWPLTRPAAETEAAGEPSPRRSFDPGRLRLEVSELPRTFPKFGSSSNRQIKLLWITCGRADVLIRVNREFKAYLDAKGIQSTYAEIPGAGHVWPLWRENLAGFAPLLFK